MSEQYPSGSEERRDIESSFEGLNVSDLRIINFVSMSRDILEHVDEDTTYLPRFSRENPVLIRFCQEPVPVDLWLQHIEEVEPGGFLSTNLIIDEQGRCQAHSASFILEEEIPDLSPDDILEMTKLSPQLIQDTFPGLERDDIFETITNEEFSVFYEDVYWIRSQLYR